MKWEPKVAIVSTSVGKGVPGAWETNVDVPETREPAAYAAWARQGDLIVAGDVNSDPDLERYVRDVGGEYLTPKDQEVWSFSDDIGWRSVQRRNVAVMVAFDRGYDYVATVDDDNLPTADWVDRHVRHLTGELPAGVFIVEGENGWVDTGQFARPQFRQRGTPYGSMRMLWSTLKPAMSPASLVVSAAQVLGEPDCDAVSRIAYNPQVTEITRNVVVGVDQYAAFNSQATVWQGKWAPLIACLPGVGRYDDIIASFIAKRIMRAHELTVYVGEPCVTQDRNPHDFTSDLRREIWGMDNTTYIIRCLDSIDLEPRVNVVDAYAQCIDRLTEWRALPNNTLKFMRAWHETWARYR